MQSSWIILWSLALCFCNSTLANWLPSTSSLQSVTQMNFMNPIRNLFRGNEAEIQAMPNTYDTLCSHESDVHPTGSCVNLATCMFSGGTAAPAMADDNCGPLEGVCCTHHLRCGDTMMSRVAFWESSEYPAMSSKSGGCTLTITPSRNICYIRAEFLDTVLTSPRAETCEGNTLTINGQVEGNSGVICGNLNQHTTFIKVNEGMAGVFRVYKDVVMHMDVQDELHKYKIKLTQIKCDQTKSSPIKLSRRHSRTFDGIEIASEKNESVSVHEYGEDAGGKEPVPETEHRGSAAPSRVKRQVVHGAKRFSSHPQSKHDFSPVSVPNPQDTLHLQNKQVLGEWTWLRNMVSSLPSSLPSFENILDSQDSKAPVQPLKSDTLLSGCDPRNTALCLSSNENPTVDDVKRLSKPSSSATPPIATATKSSISVFSSDANIGFSKEESLLKQLLGERISPNKHSDSKLPVPEGPSILNSRLSELLRSQISSRAPQPTVDDEGNLKIDQPASLSSHSPAPPSSEQSQQTMSNSEKTFVESIENSSESRYSIASSNQKPGESNKQTHVYNNTDTYIEEFGTTTTHIKNATTNTNKSASLSVPEGNSTVIADDISLRELKESIDEESEARRALGDGLSIPRRRPAYGNMADDGFVVLVSPLENAAKNDNNYDTVPQRGDLDALAQHVGKLAASNFIANFRQSSGTDDAEGNDSQSASEKPSLGTRKEKDTSYYGYIIVKNEVGEHFFCSATLITPQHALTAASCVMRKGFETKNYKIHAVFNEDDLGDARYRTGASLFNNTNHARVTQTVFHPMYKHGSLHFDLAVLKLERDMKKCNPISIARPDTELMGEDITILGHGVRPTPALTFAAYQRHLTYISGRYLHQAACNEFYEDSPRIGKVYRHDFIKPEMLCVLSSEGVQLCEGDQGGPVIVSFDDDRKEPRLVGIASGNDNNCIGVQRKNIGEFPDVAVRLTWPIVEFIETATAEIFFQES